MKSSKTLIYCIISVRYLNCITSPIVTFPITITGHFPTGTLHISQIATFLLLSPLYQKYWSLSYRYLPHISQVSISVPFLPVHVHPLYRQCSSLPYRYIPYITSTGPLCTVTSSISQVLVLALPAHPLYH